MQWTGCTTPYLGNTRGLSQRRTLVSQVYGLVWLVAVSLACAEVGAAGFKVNDADIRLVDGKYLLDADLGLDFSEESIEALKHGVPLTLVVDMDIREQRRFLWDKRVARRRETRTLQSHALSKRYVLKNLNSGTTRSFDSLSDAMAELKRVQGLPVVESDVLVQDKNYQVRLRARLDIEALPAPLRPLAYLKSIWGRSSKWSTWPIEP